MSSILLRFLMVIMMVGVISIELDFAWGFQKYIILWVFNGFEGCIASLSGREIFDVVVVVGGKLVCIYSMRTISAVVVVAGVVWYGPQHCHTNPKPKFVFGPQGFALYLECLQSWHFVVCCCCVVVVVGVVALGSLLLVSKLWKFQPNW